MQPLNVLIVEDDATSQLMLKTMLAAHRLILVDSGEAALEAAAEGPDLVILDINLPGIDGYETCRRLRAAAPTHDTPVLFLSSYSALEDRLQAYGAGGNDYVSKPFDVAELMTKIDILCRGLEQRQSVTRELQDAQGLLLGVQTSAAKLQSISRFIQATLFCHDIDTLFRHFFRTARDIGLECILRIDSEAGSETRVSDGDISVLEQEILDLSARVERIYTFGRDRAIFRWRSATLLTRRVGDMIDTIAIFMDALEAGIKAVDTESRLLHQVHELETHNALVRDRITDLFGQMSTELKDALLALGLASALDQNDEDRLNDLLEGFNQRIDAQLQTLGENNRIIQGLIGELRTPPPELRSLMESAEEEDDGGDGITLF